MANSFTSPYIPNTSPEIRQAMLDELGIKSTEELYRSVIPDDLLFKGRLDLPEPIQSEYELRRHVRGILNKNTSTEEYISFLGAGCYRHQVPAICDELNQRGEFLTAYCGDTYSDHGKMQAFFEYASLMGELLDADLVTYPCYDGAQAAASSLGTALRMQLHAGREADCFLVPETMHPEVLSQIREFWHGKAEIVTVPCLRDRGIMDLTALEALLSGHKAAAVYYENPSYLGFFETQAQEIADLAHAHKAYVVASAEVASLGLIESPMNLGADIVCGDIQPLGMHQQFGGGQAGYIACRNERDFIEQLPTYLYGIIKTDREDRFGWGRSLNYRCSHGSREKANEYFGTVTGLWAITAGIYLSAMGPRGMEELAESILIKLDCLEKRLAEIPCIAVNPFGTKNFQEFLISFEGIGLTAADVNRKLLKRGIFGGKDLSDDFPWLGQSALYCVSELTSEEDMDALVTALSDIVKEAR